MGWKRLLIFCTLLSVANARRRIRTEEEEAKYLQELKERELRTFEMEMKQQSEQRGGKYSSAQFGVQLDGGGYDSMELPKELRGPATPRRKSANAVVQAQALRSEPIKTSQTSLAFEQVDEFGEEENWCYYCATPIDKLRPEMRKSIRNLLEMRRTAFPIEAVTPECLSARNLTKLKKQKCSYKYCQTLSILDRNAGNAFVVRGCAEHFGAINVPELEKKNDHSCEMIHEKLEIKECICKSDKYCHAGWRKRSAGGAYRQSLLTWLLLLVVFFFD